MRYLFSLLLCLSGLYTLSAQTNQYVWAPSGLTLRSAGHSGAEKIGVIPYGGEVELTGNYGDRIDLPVIKAFSVEIYDDEHQSQPWSMSDNYVEVNYQGESGWLFAGYLFYLPPLGTSEPGLSIDDWLEKVAGPPKKLFAPDGPQVNFREQAVYRYEYGIVRVDEYGEGWGGSTWSIPLGTLNDGYLLGEAFFGLSASLDKTRSPEEEDYMILEEVAYGRLYFSQELSEITIQVVGGVLLISSAGGC